MARDFTKKSWIFILFFVGFCLFNFNVKAQNCDVPVGLNATNLSNFSATLNWTFDSNVDHYRLRYKEVNTSIWSFEHNATGNSEDISGLMQNATYIWQAKAFCSTGNSPSSGWSAVDTFITANDVVDCNNTPNGTAYYDDCGNCVGGNTGKSECIDFTPTVNISLSTTDCNVPTDIIFQTSQDPNEPDISSTFVVSDAGSFDFTGLATNDVIGSTVIVAGGGTINVNATLMVDFIISPDKISVKAVNDATGQIEASFTIENSGAGILIVATSGTDNNNVTSGNSQLINLNGLFITPSPSTVTFTCTINSELGDIDAQDFPFSISCLVYDCNGDLNGGAYLDSCGNCVGGNTGNIACVPFSPTVTVNLSSLDCDSISDLTIDVSQDPNEPDMSTSLFVSNGGAFDIINMSIGDTIGIAYGTPGSGTSYSSDLVVSTIITSDQAIVNAVEHGTGQVLGSFTISNSNPGINISAQSIADGNNVTSGNYASVGFYGVFVNPGAGALIFTSTINSDLGDQDIQSQVFNINCVSAYDCNGDFNGTAYLDNCGNCVGGNTGDVECIDFTPTVSVLISNTNCDSLSNLTINVSQDPNEPDMSTSLFSSNGGSFDIINMSIGDTIGSAIMVAGSTQNPQFTFNTRLIVSSIISSDQVIIQSVNNSDGQVLGSFTVSNTNPGISITAQNVADSNNVTSGNSQSVIFNNVFINPGAGNLEFTSTINSELGDQDIQTTSFNIICAPMCLQQGDANCDGIVNLADLTLVINNWLQSTSIGSNGDVVGSMDGFVNLADLTLIINNWLQTTP